MKRWMMAGAALVLALTLGTVGTLAASPWCRGGQRDCLQNGVCDGSYCRYVDADGNGVCDNHNCRGPIPTAMASVTTAPAAM